MKVTVTRPLSQKGVTQMTRIFRNMNKNIPKLKQEFNKRSLNYIEKRANYYISKTTGGSNWYQLTGTLSSSWVKNPRVGTLINNCFYSAFVEFGTGMTGAGTHPSPKGYQYDVNEHEEYGWYFYAQGDFHFTTGMPAHKYLYDAVNDYVNGEYRKIFERSFNYVMGGILK